MNSLKTNPKLVLKWHLCWCGWTQCIMVQQREHHTSPENCSVEMPASSGQMLYISDRCRLYSIIFYFLVWEFIYWNDSCLFYLMVIYEVSFICMYINSYCASFQPPRFNDLLDDFCVAEVQSLLMHIKFHAICHEPVIFLFCEYLCYSYSICIATLWNGSVQAKDYIFWELDDVYKWHIKDPVVVLEINRLRNSSYFSWKHDFYTGNLHWTTRSHLAGVSY